ncbi:hypothetical protein Sjap_017690 [Stephania japonica]|uniref:Uncharacterized protein n=1 Tax=Stephania japonica TaxID=461633 RepID=A0AAP0NKQ1_9MAGN
MANDVVDFLMGRGHGTDTTTPATTTIITTTSAPSKPIRDSIHDSPNPCPTLVLHSLPITMPTRQYIH